MADFLSTMVKLSCPRCGGPLQASLKEVKDQSFVVCRCGDRIRLTNDDGTGHPRGDVPGLEAAVGQLQLARP